MKLEQAARSAGHWHTFVYANILFWGVLWLVAVNSFVTALVPLLWSEPWSQVIAYGALVAISFAVLAAASYWYTYAERDHKASTDLLRAAAETVRGHHQRADLEHNAGAYGRQKAIENTLSSNFGAFSVVPAADSTAAEDLALLPRRVKVDEREERSLLTYDRPRHRPTQTPPLPRGQAPRPLRNAPVPTLGHDYPV